MIKKLYTAIRSFFRMSGSHKKEYQDHYYHNLLNQYNNNDSYVSLYLKCMVDHSVKTTVEICFSGSVRFGSNIQTIHRVLDKPSYHIKKNNSTLNIDILIYRLLIGNHKVTCQMHLFENKLFLFNYSFPYINEYENERVMQIIQRKYFAGINKYNDHNIVDCAGNCLQIVKGVDLTINYLAMESDFFLKIMNLTMTKEEKIKKQYITWYNEIYDRV